MVLANRQAEEMFGYEAGELWRPRSTSWSRPEIRNLHRAHREAYHRDPRTRPMGSGLDLYATRRDGTTGRGWSWTARNRGIVRDSDRVQAERRIREIQQTLDFQDVRLRRRHPAGRLREPGAAARSHSIARRVALISPNWTNRERPSPVTRRRPPSSRPTDITGARSTRVRFQSPEVSTTDAPSPGHHRPVGDRAAPAGRAGAVGARGPGTHRPGSARHRHPAPVRRRHEPAGRRRPGRSPRSRNGSVASSTSSTRPSGTSARPSSA